MSSGSPNANDRPAARSGLAYLSARGFTPATIESLGWRIDVLNGDASRYALPRGTEAWVIPYPERDGRPAFERVRVLDEASEACGRGKYRQPAGVSLDLYDPRGWLEGDDLPEYLLLIEGEANAAAVAQMYHAMPVVGLPGQRALKADLAKRLAGVSEVYLWLDRGSGFIDSASSAAERLRDAGVGRVLFCDSGGRDANELLVERGPAGGRAAVDAILNAARLSLDDGAALLDDLAGFVRRFVSMGKAEADATALWIVHSHAVDVADTTPYLSITSAEKRSGKSRLLEVLSHLVANPMTASNMTDAVLFRAITLKKPTLLFDEVDAVFGPKARDREELRAMLNSGYRRGTPAYRCEPKGKDWGLREFEVFCAKALAGIGRLPETVADRSVPIRLRRRAPGEHVERARLRDLAAGGEPLRERCARWAADCHDALAAAEPLLPRELDDRAQDVCEPLVAIGRGRRAVARARPSRSHRAAQRRYC